MIGVVGRLPARLAVDVVESTVRDAAQSNVEGTVLDFPGNVGLPPEAGRVDVTIVRSVLRDAGSRGGFADGGANVLLLGSQLFRQPLAGLQHRLHVIDSEIAGATAAGVQIAVEPAEGGAPDPGRFSVLLRGNRFVSNAGADLVVGGPEATVDASGNCWVAPDGEEGVRITMAAVASAVTPVVGGAVSCPARPAPAGGRWHGRRRRAAERAVRRADGTRSAGRAATVPAWSRSSPVPSSSRRSTTRSPRGSSGC